MRLVLTPEQVVLAEARRSYTTLSLFGYRVDGVVANRVFPADDADPWRAGWVAAQAERPRPGGRVVRRASRSGARSTARPSRSGSRRSRTSADGCTAVATRSPYLRGGSRSGSPGPRTARCCTCACRSSAARDVDLARDGDDLVVTVASYRRLLTLPAGLARHRVAGARVDGGELQVRFAAETE